MTGYWPCSRFHGNGPSVSSPIDVTSLLDPATPPPPPSSSNNTKRACGQGKLFWTKPERKQTAFSGEIKKRRKKRQVFGHPEYHGHSACSSHIPHTRIAEQEKPHTHTKEAYMYYIRLPYIKKKKKKNVKHNDVIE